MSYTRDENGKMIEIDDISPEIREKMQDLVNSPPHYTHGDIEPIDFMRDQSTQEEFVGHCTLTAIKYLSRWRHKGGVEDLRKARKYLDWAIDREIDSRPIMFKEAEE